jgi:hypothetical protein
LEFTLQCVPAPDMNPARVAAALSLVVPVCAALVLLLSLLPAPFALSCGLAGMVLFKVGADLGWRWSTVVGGACMFSGAFAWALAVT